MKLSIAYSPCPNDTFIFDALVNKKIDTEGIDFEVILEDVETLNQHAQEGRYDITKLSFPAYFYCSGKYMLLNSGSAIGNGVGPLVVCLPTNESMPVENGRIALPGKSTTANLLFSFAFPGSMDKRFMVFSDIENAVLNGDVEFGVIIHENRFTYQEKGLIKRLDLGEYWEQKKKLPIPLGGIACKRSLDEALALKVESLIRKSLEYSFNNYPAIPDYVRLHAQTMSEEVMRQHIDLYVNEFSKNLGDVGWKAIDALWEVYDQEGLNNQPSP